MAMTTDDVLLKGARTMKQEMHWLMRAGRM